MLAAYKHIGLTEYYCSIGNCGWVALGPPRDTGPVARLTAEVVLEREVCTGYLSSTP